MAYLFPNLSPAELSQALQVATTAVKREMPLSVRDMSGYAPPHRNASARARYHSSLDYSPTRACATNIVFDLRDYRGEEGYADKRF